MKRLLLLPTLIFLTIRIFAQAPPNDECASAANFGVAPNCSMTTFYTNVGATASNIDSDFNLPLCFQGGNTNRDVWFKFVASDTILDYSILLTGAQNGAQPSIRNPQMAVYRGDCTFGELQELACGSANAGETKLELKVNGLTPGEMYFIRINDWSVSATPNAGSFMLCVKEKDPVSTINQGGSTACEGELYDSGGPSNDYGNSENFVYKICPSSPSKCITFELDYYNIESGQFGVGGDQLTFFAGADTTAPVIQTINGGFSTPSAGGVCLKVKANSNCLTIKFKSDATGVFEGFKGHWKCSPDECPIETPISVSNENVTKQQIINSISPNGTTVTIDTIICPSGAFGTFIATDDSNLGLKKGLVFASGNAQNAVGPNLLNNVTTTYQAPGDSDLDYLAGGGITDKSNDACVVELDVFAGTDLLTFEYVFGSDEYPEFVNSGFNDIFAFLISGPGIVGDPNIGNQKNIAVLNNGSPVEINNVSNLQNWQFYRDNQGGESVEYDGLTSDSLGIKKSLTARAKVTPCKTYHLKLAVADRGDFSYDSGVFISEIKSAGPSLNVKFASGIDYFLENCGSTGDQLVIKLGQALTDTLRYTVQIGGTATLGTDYTLNIPNVITFLPGQTELNFPIVPISDALTEPDETIVISLFKNYGCGDFKVATVTVLIKDKASISINAGADTAIICKNSKIVLNAVGTQTFSWSPISIFNNPSLASPTASTNTSQWVTVTGTVGGVCVAKDSIFLKVIAPVINIAALSDTNICEGKSVMLVASNNLNNAALKWTPNFGINNPNSPSVTVTPTFTTTYTATVKLAGCSVSDQITIKVDPYNLLKPQKDTTICQKSGVKLGYLNPFDTFFVQTIFKWTPSVGLSNPNKWNPTASPDTTTTYQVISSSQSNFCRDTFKVKITVLPANVSILAPNIVNLCKGDKIILNTNSSTNGVGLTWSPVAGLNQNTGPTVTATPTQSQQYIVKLVTGICTVFDTVAVRLDSLPNAPIQAIPSKNIYCPGEIISLVSPDYNHTVFPILQYQWLPQAGFLTPLTNYNAVIRASTQTLTYSRIIKSGACADTSEYKINVLNPSAELSVRDTSVCAGENVNVRLTAPLGARIEWTPGDPILISCSDCPNPTLTPKGTTTYKVKITVDGSCAAEAAIKVTILSSRITLLVTPSREVEKGDTVQVRVVPADSTQSFVWMLNGATLPDTKYLITKIISESENLFKATYFTPNGCISQDTALVIGTEPVIKIPNAFSPDGDNTNDNFNIVAKSLDRITIKTFRIFDRWGGIVYDNEKPSDGWDGSKNGTPLPPDVYAYYLEAVIGGGSIKKYSGQVTLIR